MRRLVIFGVCILLGCAPTQDESVLLTVNEVSPSRALFVASGSCYAGGATTSVGSSTIAAFDPDTGSLKRLIVDYNAFSPGDSPVAVANYDDSTLMVAVENASGRRIDLVKKDGSLVQTYISNATALSAALRSIELLPDSSLLVSKSSAIEKFSSGKSRVLQGVNPFVNAPAGTCATTTTLFSSVASFTNGKIVATHAAATPNNKIILISASGYAAAGDCLASQASPTTTALPTSLLIHSSGKLLVGYGSATLASNFVYSYQVNTTTNSISGATAAYLDTSILYGVSAMIEDASTQLVYIASGGSTYNTIERLSLASSGTLTRTTSKPLIASSVYTRCVASMAIGTDI